MIEKSHKFLKVYNVNPKTICLLMGGFFILLLLHIFFGWIWLAMFAFRTGVTTAASKFVPGLGRPWSYKDVLFIEDYYNQRHRESIVELLTLQGDISCAKIRQRFTQNVLQAKIKNSSKLKFPELTQVRRSFLGFLFWADDPFFKIENHIKEVFYDDKGTTTPNCFNNFENMMEEFSQRSYLQDTSPWECWVVRGFPGNKSYTQTVLIFRCHHSLADGYSVANLLLSLVGREATDGALPQTKLLKSPPRSRSFFFTLFSIISSLVDFLVGFYRLQLNLIHNRRLKQRLRAERRKRGGGGVTVVDEDKVHFKFSSKLPLSQVKALAAQLGVRVPVLLTALVAHNFAKILHLDDLATTTTTTLYSPFVLPLANHPDTLANHMSLGGVHLPISKSLSFGSKLKSTNDSFLGLCSDPANPVIAYLEWILGNCPVWIVRWLKTNTTTASSLAYSPLFISNVVLDTSGFTLEGLPVEIVSTGLAPIRNVTDSAIFIQGLGNTVHVTFGVHDRLFCEEDVERMASGIGKDFEELLQNNKFWKC